MSNTIKLKRGSGSDPGSSALSVGEVALRTDNGKLFTKKDDGSVVQIGGGSGAIDDGAITNAKVASDAAIAGSKISPDFTADVSITNGQPTISFVDSSHNPDYMIRNADGAFIFNDTTNQANRIVINTDGHVDVVGNLDVGNGIDVEDGDITLASGHTVDGRDVSADGTKLDGIESNATADQTASEILTLLKTVDGNGSGLDADRLQDVDAAFLRNASNLNSGTISDDRLPSSISSDITGNAATATTLATSRTIAGTSFNGSANIDISYNNLTNKPTIPTNNNQLTNGAGYITSADGGNAGTLDGIDSSEFLRSNTGDTASGDITFSGGAGAVTIGGNSDIRFTSGNWTGESCKIQHHENRLYIQGGSNDAENIILRSSSGSNRWIMSNSGDFYPANDNAYEIGGSGNRVQNLWMAGGIYLGGTGSGNYLDHYEEGTWNPILRGGSNDASGYSIQDGHYVKVGAMLTVTFAIAITGKGSMSGDLFVRNIPFDVQNELTGTSIEASGICGYWKHVSPNSSTLTLVADQANYLYFRHTVGPEDDPDQMQASDIDSDFTVRATITYFTNE
jgi:hypothetical protein